MHSSSLSRHCPDSVLQDDLLLAPPPSNQCEKDTLTLLRYLAAKGHKVNLKAQLAQEEIQFLAHMQPQVRHLILVEFWQFKK